MNPLAPKRGPAAAALGLTLLAHALLLVWMWQTRWAGAPAVRAGERPPVVQLLWPPTPHRQDEVRHQPAPRERQRAAARRSHTPMEAVSSTPGGAPDRAAQAISLPPPEPAASRPLDLGLPAASRATAPNARNQALNDPRANTGRKTASEQFAATLGTDLTKRVTPLDGGRRIQRGTSCIEVMDSRASQIDPYGPKWPGGVRSCD